MNSRHFIMHAKSIGNIRSTSRGQRPGVSSSRTSISAPAAARTGRYRSKDAKTTKQTQKPNQDSTIKHLLPTDELGCIHFESCPGCSQKQQLHDPPIVSKARAFSSSRGLDYFKTVPGPVHGWRCRAKLAVRGSAAAPQLGLFQLGSHQIVAMPECRAHHPRINQAVQLVQQVVAALRIAPYTEPQQQQQQQQQQARRQSSSSSSSSRRSGYLRYIQATVLPSKPGGRAEEDPQAQVQLVLVWAAADGSHPSVADAKRLVAALWSQGGPKHADRLQRLRTKADQQQQQQQQQQQKPRTAGSSSRTTLNNAAAAAADVPLLHSVWLNFQPDASNNAVLGRQWLLLAGPQWGWQDFGGVAVAVAPGSFVQANYGAMQRCLAAIAAAVPPGSSVVELYAGCGVIGLTLAAAGLARRVVCVEVNPETAAAFEVTRAALARSKPAAAAAISHHVASANDPVSLQQLLAGTDAQVMVVDPPRKGLDPHLLQLLTADAFGSRNSSSSSSGGGSSNGNSITSSSSSSNPLPQLRRLVYLSCGFQALMADTDALLAAGWKLSSCQAYFFFPGTDSIETLAVFDR